MPHLIRRLNPPFLLIKSIGDNRDFQRKRGVILLQHVKFKNLARRIQNKAELIFVRVLLHIMPTQARVPKDGHAALGREQIGKGLRAVLKTEIKAVHVRKAVPAHILLGCNINGNIIDQMLLIRNSNQESEFATSVSQLYPSIRELSERIVSGIQAHSPALIFCRSCLDHQHGQPAINRKRTFLLIIDPRMLDRRASAKAFVHFTSNNRDGAIGKLNRHARFK